jgi:membrane protein
MASTNITNAADEDTRRRAQDQGRGRHAEKPSQIPFTGWKDVFWRVVAEISADRIMLIAAGATFYLLLALFPALAAFVSIYGFVADPQTIADHIAFLGGVLPSGGVEIIQSQLQSLVQQDTGSLSFGFITGLLLALWSANSGIKTLFDAMNIAYEEEEKRGFIKLNLLSMTFTLGAILIAVLFLVSVGIVPALLAILNLGGVGELLIRILRWPVMLVAVAFAITLIYRFGPSRRRAQWRWLTWGAGIATVVWIAASIGFSYYLENFANYNATYGTLGAVIGFMVWTWISVMILLVGAELNAELEHQTMIDSTIGEPVPIGGRGATMADTLGKSSEEK